MRRVLIICYDFPRISSAGVIRIYQLAKRLPEFGWQPVILTSQACGSQCEDDIEISDGPLPCPKITATPMRVPFQFRGEKSRISLEGAARRADGRIKRLIGAAGRLPVPDGKIGWLVPAVKTGAQIACDYPIEACLSVSPRPTAHLVAHRLSRRLNIPWVADFALPWSDAYWLTGRPGFINSLDHKLEKLIVRSARHVTVAYAEIARSLATRFGPACEEKTTVIPTGFDEDLFTQQNPPTSAKFTVVYPGNHFCEKGREGEYFLRAIDEWIDSNPGLKEKVEFVFIGKRDENLLRHRRAMAHPGVIRVEPLISHRACVQGIRSSDMCVVNAVGNRIPGKVYECMRAGKWVLALTDSDSDLSTIVRQYSRGLVVPAGSVFAIRQALERVRQQYSTQTMAPSDSAVNMSLYSAKRSAEMLALILDSV
ncbi:MAG: glycosyltransferase [Candidatus Binatia bacterium]